MIKVASYCRVSTGSQDQANSLESQQRFFREYINSHPDWDLYDVYADEGISGTSTKNRIQFNRMMQDAHHRKFSLIITKEVSRFSRNLLDTIAYTRELKALGIGVIFMNDGFCSLDPDSELRLSIMGSIAQEESRKTSSRVKWGQTRQMEQGVVFGSSLLGYDVVNGKLTINPEGAEIVRMIFHKYGVEHKGTSRIAKELRQSGIRTFTQNPNWSSSHIIKILHNEKYAGDLVQKKSITPDYLTHARKYNRGEEALIIIRNHHEPIIERELWDLVQHELQERSTRSCRASAPSNKHILSGKLICGQCGARFVSRQKARKDGTSYMRWVCCTAATHRSASGCDIGKTIRDALAMELVTASLQRIPADYCWIMRNLVELLTAVVRGTEGLTESIIGLNRLLHQTIRKKETLMDAYASGVIRQEELIPMKNQYDDRINQLRDQIQANTPPPEYDNTDLWGSLESQVQSILNCNPTEETICKALVKKLVIQKDGTVSVHFNHIPQIFHYQLRYHSRPPETECN